MLTLAAPLRRRSITSTAGCWVPEAALATGVKPELLPCQLRSPLLESAFPAPVALAEAELMGSFIAGPAPDSTSAATLATTGAMAGVYGFGSLPAGFFCTTRLADPPSGERWAMA